MVNSKPEIVTTFRILKLKKIQPLYIQDYTKIMNMNLCFFQVHARMKTKFKKYKPQSEISWMLIHIKYNINIWKHVES